MTPDELKAIAERWDKHLRAMRVAEKLPGFKGWQDWERDIAALLSSIQDIRRDTAREIVEELGKLTLPRIAWGDINKFRASIRSAYGLTT